MMWNILRDSAGVLFLLESTQDIPDGCFLEAQTANPNYLLNIQGKVPASVTMRQGRLALLQYGLLDMVDNALNAIEDDFARKKAKIEWEYAQTIERDSAWVSNLAASLGLTEDQVDQLFLLADTL